MDEIVLRAIAKWPEVPAVFNWLSVDRRGNWFIKNERIANSAITEFISRNYAADEHGRWFFQNGPQRVFAKLAYTPLVYRTVLLADGGLDLVAHTGLTAGHVEGVLIDESGAILAVTDLGVGVIHDQDLAEISTRFVDAAGARIGDIELEAVLAQLSSKAPNGSLLLRLSGGSIPVAHVKCTDVAHRFGFEPDPQPGTGQPDC
ncbi:MAG: DUF2946 family protein [Betaproteobacteria bacterium]